MAGQISLVITCGNWLNLLEEVEKAEKVSAEFIHMDVMDGEYVPNYMGSTDLVRAVHLKTKIKQDIHLMIVNPEEKLSYFELREKDMVSFHIDRSKNPSKMIDLIHEAGCLAGISIAPNMDIQEIKQYLDNIDFVNVLCVKPGFAGQKMYPGSKDRVVEVKELLNKQSKKILLEVDGNVSFENAKWMKESGADIYVLGSSGAYNENNFFDNIKKMRLIIE